MKKAYLIILTLFALLYFPEITAQNLTIHTIGDSTMEQKSEDPAVNPNGQRGWAQMLSQFVTNGATVNNRSKSGTSSKTFYEPEDNGATKRFWTTVKPQIKPGDYVFIQFGHNDEKDGGEEGEIGTNPWQSYTLFLTKYVTEVRELEAIPILLTPIVRNQFSNGKITDKGAHNLGTGTDGKSLDYPAAMKQVAADLDCQLVDHTALTKAICEEYGSSKVSELIYNVGDGTHLGEYGATLYARLAVQDLIRQGILADYLNANPDLMLSVKSHDFGKCYPNTSTIYPISVSGVDLTPAAGKVKIAAPDGFSISLEQDGPFSNSAEIAYSNGSLSITRFYVKYQPSEAGKTEGKIIITYGESTKEIELKGECVTFEGGQEASVYWELSKDESFVVNGPVSGIAEKFSNMFADRYASPGSGTVWEGNLLVDGTRTQRCIIEGHNWPAGEIDIVHDRYIQFGVTATKGTVFNVDSIGLYIGAAGGSGIRYRAFYSTDPSFSEAVMIADRQNNANKVMSVVSTTNIIELKGEESLYLRIYPWYNGASVDKAICFHGVTIKGVVLPDNGNAIPENKLNDENKTSCIPTVTEGTSVLTYTLDTPSAVNITVSSISGGIVMNFKKEEQPAGTYQESLDFSSLLSGMYLCTVISNSGKSVSKVLKK